VILCAQKLTFRIHQMASLHYDIAQSPGQLLITVGLPLEAPFDQIDVELVGATQLEVSIAGCDPLQIRLTRPVDTSEGACKVKLSRKNAQLTVSLRTVAKDSPVDQSVLSYVEPAPVSGTRNEQRESHDEPALVSGTRDDQREESAPASLGSSYDREDVPPPSLVRITGQYTA
jgi:hypothetical protein